MCATPSVEVEARHTYQTKRSTYHQHTKLIQKTRYMICKRPKEELDPTLWEIPLQPLVKYHKATVTPTSGQPPYTYLVPPMLHPISLRDVRFGANTERCLGSVPLLPHLCPLSVPKGGGGMWGIFGKPLKRATDDMFEMFVPFRDDARVACYLLLSTGSHHVCIQMHSMCCCFP